MGSGSKPVEGVKLREAKAAHEGAPGAHGVPAHGTGHTAGQAPVPRSHYDSATSPVRGFSGERVPSAASAHEAAGGQRAASSSSSSAAPAGRSHYTAAPVKGAHGETAPRAATATSATGGQHQNAAPGGQKPYDNLHGVELSPPSASANHIEMRALHSQSATAEPTYGQTSFANSATTNYNNNGLKTGTGGTATPIYHAPPVTGAAAGGGHQETRFERFKAAVKRNPKKSVAIPVVIVIGAIVGGVLGGLRPWETSGTGGTGENDNTMPPKPTAKNGEQKLTSGASLTDADLKMLVAPGTMEADYAIDPATFTLHKSEIDATAAATIETDDGAWTVTDVGLLSFAPKATFVGGAAEIYFSVKDKKGTQSARAKFTVQYGPKLHDGELKEQDPKAKSVIYSVTNWDAAAKTGAFEPHDMAATSALDPASILFFDAASNTDKAPLDVPGFGTWSHVNGIISFAPLAGSMAQMVFVTYSVKDKSGSVSNRATLTVTFKPEGMVVDPNNKDMTRKPIISSNVQIVVSGKPAIVPVSSDINLKADSLRIVSGTARVSSLPIGGNGTWAAAKNVLTFTPDPGFRGAPAPVSVTARSAFDVESDPYTLSLMIFALPVVTDDYVSSSYPAVIQPLANDKVGYTMENNVLVPSSVEIFGVVSMTAGPVVAPDKKSATVPNEGAWAVNADGSVTFVPVANFTGGPKPITYTVADTKGSRSDPAVITLNRQVGDIATRFAAMMSMTQGMFFQNYVTALSDPVKKYSMFDVLDATNQLMLMFIAEAQRTGQYAGVQAARATNQTVLETATNTAMTAWMTRNFTIQGLVDATDTIRDTLIGLPNGSATIGIRALRLEVMATLVERHISLSMMVRGKAMQ